MAELERGLSSRDAQRRPHCVLTVPSWRSAQRLCTFPGLPWRPQQVTEPSPHRLLEVDGPSSPEPETHGRGGCPAGGRCRSAPTGFSRNQIRSQRLEIRTYSIQISTFLGDMGLLGWTSLLAQLALPAPRSPRAPPHLHVTRPRTRPGTDAHRIGVSVYHRCLDLRPRWPGWVFVCDSHSVIFNWAPATCQALCWALEMEQSDRHSLPHCLPGRQTGDCLTHIDNCRRKGSQQGKSGGPTESQGQGRLPELSPKGRERNSFLGRGTDLCKGLEVGSNGKAERQPGWEGMGSPKQDELRLKGEQSESNRAVEATEPILSLLLDGKTQGCLCL